MQSRTLADNHPRGALPEGERVSGARLALVIVGLMLTLPIFVLSGEVLLSLGAKTGAAALFTAGIATAALASLTGYVGARTGLTTYAIIRAPFGERASLVPTAVFAAVAAGWFGITVDFFGEALFAAMNRATNIRLDEWIYTLGGGLVMTATVLFGFKGIELLNRIAVPVLVIVLGAIAFSLFEHAGFAALWSAQGAPGAPIASFGLGVSAVLGIVAGLATGMPDLMRFAKSAKDVVAANGLSFACVSALLTVIAGAPSLVTGETDFTANLFAVGLGWPAALTIILATWTTNTVNLYAASLSLGRLAPGAPDWLVTLGAGLAGTALALAGVTGRFIGLLFVLGALLPPIAGVYLAGYFLDRENGRPVAPVFAFAAWAIGAAAALSTTFAGFAFTTIPAIDALFSAAASYALFVLAARLFTGMQRSG